MRTRLVVSVLPLALLGVVALPSHAAPKQVKKTYTASAPVADIAGLCDGTVPSSIHDEAFTAPAAGKLAATLTGYPIDWDLFVLDGAGELLGSAESFNEVQSEVAVKLKKGAKVVIRACNTGGGATASGAYTFTTK